MLFEPSYNELCVNIKIYLNKWMSKLFFVCFHPAPLSKNQPLQEVQISIFPQEVCKAKYPTMTDKMLCAGDSKERKNPCDVSFNIYVNWDDLFQYLWRLQSIVQFDCVNRLRD